MTPLQVEEIIQLIVAAYPDQRNPQATALVYHQFLADLDFELARKVIVNHVATRKWFPKISEIREAALEMRLNIESTETVMSQLQANDYGALSPMAKQALKVTGGTWEKERTTNPSAWRAQFRKAYESLREAALIEERQTATSGLLAQFNNNQPQQLEDDNNARPTRLTRGDSSGYFCHHCHRSHEASTRCPER
jgi:hypothetical protein